MKKLLMILVAVIVVVIAAVLVLERKDVAEVNLEEEVTQEVTLDLFDNTEVGDRLRASDLVKNIKIFNGIEFTLRSIQNPPVAGEETLLIYNLRIDGRPAADMQTEDGIYGKGAAVHRESMEIIPVEIVRRVTAHGTLEFRTIFPQAGEYVVFTQFKRGGNYVTTDFLISVR